MQALTGVRNKVAACLTSAAMVVAASGCTHTNSATRTSTASEAVIPAFASSDVTEEPTARSETVAEFCQVAADEYAAAGKFTEAISMFEQAHGHDPSLADANSHRLAVMHAEAGNSEQAAAFFEKALRHSPRNADLHNDYGFFLLTRRDLHAARDQFETVLELEPGHARATMNLGLLSAQQGDVTTAESHFASIVGKAAAKKNAIEIAERAGTFSHRN
jgi:Tfp pilus assembly protein PilF